MESSLYGLEYYVKGAGMFQSCPVRLPLTLQLAFFVFQAAQQANQDVSPGHMESPPIGLEYYIKSEDQHVDETHRRHCEDIPVLLLAPKCLYYNYQIVTLSQFP